MKKLYIISLAIIALCIIGTAVLLAFTPDEIPAHYNIQGEVDRFGSKYENLIFPLLAMVMGACFLLLARGQKRMGAELNEKILLYTCVPTLLFFTALGFYFMLKAINYDPATAAAVAGGVYSASFS